MESTMDTQQLEPATVGLTVEAHEKLKYLKEVELFAEMVDAYRFAITFAISRRLPNTDLASSRQTIFNTATLDPAGEIKFAIETLFPDKKEPTYKIAERLAELGVNELERLAKAGHLTIESLL